MTPVPWVVAETVALKVAGLRPGRVAIAPADARLQQAVDDVAEELALPISRCELDGPELVDLLIWRSDETRPTAGARSDLLQVAARCTGDVVVCERVVEGHGLGAGVLAAIDTSARRLATDELWDEDGQLRPRKPWEPPVLWIVAEIPAWRFGTDAELARGGYVRRLPRMSAAEMVMAARRILSRFDTAHELLLLALNELQQRGDEAGLALVTRELSLHPTAAPSVQRRAREIVAGRRIQSTSEYLRAV